MTIENFQMAIWNEFLKLGDKKRDKIEFIKTALWFAEVQRKMSAKNPHQVGKRLEPNSFGKDKNGDTYHKNLYHKYKYGRHTPNSFRIELAEKVCPGTSNLINHILWEVLQTEADTDKHINRWLRSLSPDIQTIIFTIKPNNLSLEYKRKPIGMTVSKMLMRRASLDALACFIILLKEASIQRKTQAAKNYQQSICLMLMMLCTLQPLSDYVRPLWGIICRLMDGCFNVSDISSSAEIFVIKVNLLKLLSEDLKSGVSSKTSPYNRIKSMSKLLEPPFSLEILPMLIFSREF